MKDIARSMSLAFTIIGCIAFGGVVGYYLDESTGFSPLFIMLGLLSGTVFSLMALYRWAKK